MKISFEGSILNCCFGNQPHPLEGLLYSINANSFCYFTKHYLTFKQAHRVSYCLVLYNKAKLRQGTLVFSSFHRLHLETTLFCTTPSGQIIPCHKTNVKMLIFYLFITTPLIFKYPKFQEFLLNTFPSRNVGLKSVGTKINSSENCT